MTDPFAALSAAAAAAANEGVALQQALAALTAQHAADQATIAELEAELHPTPPPVPQPTATTVFGMNLGSRSVAQRTQQFGAVPMVKLFTLADVAGTVPGKRAQVCSPFNQADLAAGKLDAQIAKYITGQLSKGVKLLLITNYQEPENILKAGQTAVDQWHAANRRLAQVIQANGEKGVTLSAPCLIAPHKQTGMNVPDSWMHTPDDLGGLDWARWTLDDYGNPFGAKNFGGDVYATPYPDPADIAGQAIALLDKHGWLGNWGISEFNTPWRKDLKPADADHSRRIAYLDGYVKACLGASTPPEHMLLWEEQGNQYDQTFTVPAEYNWWKSWVAKSV
jgi:hypothetical protein